MLLVIARQLINENSDITVDYRAQEATKTYIKEIDRFKKRVVLSPWTVPKV